MNLFTKEQQKSYENAKICYICRRKFQNKYVKAKKIIVKLDIIVITQGNIEVLPIAYVV